MDWMKILSKGWIYVAQTIIIISLVVCLVTYNSSGNASESKDDTSITISGETTVREDLDGIREELGELKTTSEGTIELITELIDSYAKLTDGFDTIVEQVSKSADITGELTTDTTEHSRRIREVSDITLESELVNDKLQQLLRSIESESGYNGD